MLSLCSCGCFANFSVFFLEITFFVFHVNLLDFFLPFSCLPQRYVQTKLYDEQSQAIMNFVT